VAWEEEQTGTMPNLIHFCPHMDAIRGRRIIMFTDDHLVHLGGAPDGTMASFPQRATRISPHEVGFKSHGFSSQMITGRSEASTAM
jgi:hypothetical protein